MISFASKTKDGENSSKTPSRSKILRQEPKNPVTQSLSNEDVFIQRKANCSCGGGCPTCLGTLGVQAKLKIGAPNDVYEQEADRVADQVMARSPNSNITKTAPRIQRVPTSTGSSGNSVPSSVHRVLASSGRPMKSGLRKDMEQRFSQDFSQVRLHTGAVAEQSAGDVSARAYTVENNVVFGTGQFSPSTITGKRLIAHELTHVVQQNGSRLSEKTLQRDLAIEPPSPDAVPGVLTPTEMRSALRYNRGRFQDPWSIRVIRDVLGGIPEVPAIIDEAFVNKIVEWQAQRGLRQDGQVGVATTRSLIAEVRAEHQPALVRQLRLDNRVRTTDTTARTFGNCRNFRWVVSWNTTLRNGWIVQEIVNQDDIRTCAGPAVGGPAPNVPHYWEAWRVNARGNVSNGGSDSWIRGGRPGTRGTWGMRGRVYTVQSLDPAAGFVAGSVVTAGVLMATTTRPRNLGLVELNRRAGGRWDCCPPNNTHVPV